MKLEELEKELARGEVRPAYLLAGDEPLLRDDALTALRGAVLGGSADEHTTVGEIIGRGFGPDEITDAIETVVETYLSIRLDAKEKFLDAYRRVGPAPFKEALYAGEAKAA